MRTDPEKPPAWSAQPSIRRHVTIAILGFGVLVFGIGGVAMGVELAGAVVAPGSVIVDSHVKKVQHPTGGVVGEIRVRDGQHVEAGDVVMRLDPTVAAASLAIVSKGLDELAARQARLEAERDGTSAVVFPAAFLPRMEEPELSALLAGERRVFEARRDARGGQESQLRERVAQNQEQIEGFSLQAAARADEISLIQEELVGIEELYRQQLVTKNRVNSLKREATRLRGERGELISRIAEAKGRISETELQIQQISQDLQSEVSRDLREIQAKTAELTERKIAAEDQLKRIDIHAPQQGVVHQLAFHTVGGVITAGEPIMLIVPESDDLLVEAKVGPNDIDQIRLDQAVVLRMSAFNQRTTPELKGRVSLVAADLTADQRTGAQYYLVRIAIERAELQRLGSLKLIPGMPVESFIQTGQRTVASYLSKPLLDQMSRAFKHD